MWARNPWLRRLRLSVDTGRVARIVAIVNFDHVAQQVPDIAEALDWWQRMVPGARVLYADDTWGLLEAGGARLAFVMAGEHPDHLAFKVSGEELERLATERGAAIAVHRDGSRSFYVGAPGGRAVEVIAYPDVLAEDAE
jgi:catechol 2,3-dioxygenase-like lactoylglutathione lyase family enzyme